MGPAGRSPLPPLTLLAPLCPCCHPSKAEKICGTRFPWAGPSRRGRAGCARADPHLLQEGAHFLKGPGDSLATRHDGKPHPTFNRKEVTVGSMILRATPPSSLGKTSLLRFSESSWPVQLSGEQRASRETRPPYQGQVGPRPPTAASENRV